MSQDRKNRSTTTTTTATDLGNNHGVGDVIDVNLNTNVNQSAQPQYGPSQFEGKKSSKNSRKRRHKTSFLRKVLQKTTLKRQELQNLKMSVKLLQQAAALLEQNPTIISQNTQELSTLQNVQNSPKVQADDFPTHLKPLPTSQVSNLSTKSIQIPPNLQNVSPSSPKPEITPVLVPPTPLAQSITTTPPLPTHPSPTQNGPKPLKNPSTTPPPPPPPPPPPLITPPLTQTTPKSNKRLLFETIFELDPNIPNSSRYQLNEHSKKIILKAFKKNVSEENRHLFPDNSASIEDVYRFINNIVGDPSSVDVLNQYDQLQLDGKFIGVEEESFRVDYGNTGEDWEEEYDDLDDDDYNDDPGFFYSEHKVTYPGSLEKSAELTQWATFLKQFRDKDDLNLGKGLLMNLAQMEDVDMAGRILEQACMLTNLSFRDPKEVKERQILERNIAIGEAKKRGEIFAEDEDWLGKKIVKKKRGKKIVENNSNDTDNFLPAKNNDNKLLQNTPSENPSPFNPPHPADIYDPDDPNPYQLPFKRLKTSDNASWYYNPKTQTNTFYDDANEPIFLDAPLLTPLPFPNTTMTPIPPFLSQFEDTQEDSENDELVEELNENGILVKKKRVLYQSTAIYEKIIPLASRLPIFGRIPSNQIPYKNTGVPVRLQQSPVPVSTYYQKLLRDFSEKSQKTNPNYDQDTQLSQFGPKNVHKPFNPEDSSDFYNYPPEDILEYSNCSKLYFSLPPQHVLLIKKPGQGPQISAMRRVADFLIKRGITVYVEPKVHKTNEFCDLHALDLAAPGNGIDFAVTLGGDGTVLHYNSLFTKSWCVIPPVVCFSLGSLGFLAPFKFIDYQFVLDTVLSAHERPVYASTRSRLEATVFRKGQYTAKYGEFLSNPDNFPSLSFTRRRRTRIPKRSNDDEVMFKALGIPTRLYRPRGSKSNKKCGKDKSNCKNKRDSTTPPPRRTLPEPRPLNKLQRVYSLNEFSLQRGLSNRASIQLFIDGHYSTTLEGDGILISTPTGSTGYSMSASGPMVSPSAPSLVITPIAKQSLGYRTIAADDTTVIRMRVDGNMNQDTPLIATFDGRQHLELFPGDSVQVRKSRVTLPTIVFTEFNTDWFGGILSKLHWNATDFQVPIRFPQEDENGFVIDKPVQPVEFNEDGYGILNHDDGNEDDDELGDNSDGDLGFDHFDFSQFRRKNPPNYPKSVLNFGKEDLGENDEAMDRFHDEIFDVWRFLEHEKVLEQHKKQF